MQKCISVNVNLVDLVKSSPSSQSLFQKILNSNEYLHVFSIYYLLAKVDVDTERLLILILIQPRTGLSKFAKN